MTTEYNDNEERQIEFALLQKKKFALSTIGAARSEFIDSFKRQKKKQPDFTQPMTHLFFNAWLAAQPDRNWEESKPVRRVRSTKDTEYAQTRQENRMKKK